MKHIRDIKQRKTRKKAPLPPSPFPPRTIAYIPGYSQSRSRPSNWCSVRKVTTDWVNLSRLILVAAISEYFLPPSFHPPMAISTFRLGFTCFSPTADLYAPGGEMKRYVELVDGGVLLMVMLQFLL